MNKIEEYTEMQRKEAMEVLKVAPNFALIAYRPNGNGVIICSCLTMEMMEEFQEYFKSINNPDNLIEL